MKKLSVIVFVAFLATISLLSKCNTENGPNQNAEVKMDDTVSYGGYKTAEQWEKHIVTIAGCSDCHPLKKMASTGAKPNIELTLSGHSANMPSPDTDRNQIESKGLAVTNDLTAWVGPWGISYVANITSDNSTGIGKWSLEQFMACLRKGKYMGLEKARNLLVHMTWQDFQNLTDNEMKVVFAYLKSTKPIHNIVPQTAAPLMARQL